MACITLLIKPAGGACNMNCTYCFYKDEAKFRTAGSNKMSAETLENIYAKTLPYATGRCVVAFQGGEPTLAGLPFFEKAVSLEAEYCKKYNISVENTFQTNGLLIDDKWARFFAENNFLVGISLDGDAPLHDANRLDNDGFGTHKRVMAAISILKKHKVDFNVLTVVTNRTCKNPTALYGYFVANGLNWQQYIPCIEPLNEPCGGQEQWLSPQEYANFLCGQFNCWYRDIKRGRPTYNRFFNNLLNILKGCQPEACDMRGMCSPQLVVEADGSVYPCDFYCADNFRLGNFNTNTLQEIENKRTELQFIQNSVFRDAGCSECKWFKLCRGGCKRDRARQLNDDYAASRNRLCEAYKMFYEHSFEKLCEIERMI